jgi:hypothetical protein
MKSVSIDAIRQRKVEIEAKIAGVIQAQQLILDTAEAANNRNLTVEEESAFNTNTEKMKPLKADLARQDFILNETAAQLEREKNMGAVPNDNVRGDDPKARKDGFHSFGEQLVAVARAGMGRGIDPRLSSGDFDNQGNFRASGGSDGALNEAVPSEGGFLVDADTSDRIYQRTYATGEITRRCMKQAIGANSNRLKLRIVDEDSRADGSRMGGVIAFWQNEADTFLSSRPKFRVIELVLNKLTAEINFRVEDALFNGTGAGQPAGILNSQALLKLSPGSTATVVVTADVLAMWAQFWHPGLLGSIASIATENLTPGPPAVGQVPGAAWFIDQSVIPQLFALQLGTGATAILLYHPPGYYGLPGPYGQLLGIPVIPTEHQAQLGTIGDIVLADMSQVLLADKGAVQAAASMHVRFVQDEMTFRFTYRVDAQTTWKKPLAPKSGGPNLSPFLALNSGANR